MKIKEYLKSKVPKPDWDFWSDYANTLARYFYPPMAITLYFLGGFVGFNAIIILFLIIWSVWNWYLDYNKVTKKCQQK